MHELPQWAHGQQQPYRQAPPQVRQAGAKLSFLPSWWARRTLENQVEVVFWNRRWVGTVWIPQKGR